MRVSTLFFGFLCLMQATRSSWTSDMEMHASRQAERAPCMDLVTAADFSLNFSKREAHRSLAGDLKDLRRPFARAWMQSMAAFTQLTFESVAMTRLSSLAMDMKSPVGSILGTEALDLRERRASRRVDHFFALRPDQKSPKSEKIWTGSARSKVSSAGFCSWSPAPWSSWTASWPFWSSCGWESSVLRALRGTTLFPSFWAMRLSMSFFMASLTSERRRSRMTLGGIHLQSSAVSSLDAVLTAATFASYSFFASLSRGFGSRAFEPYVLSASVSTSTPLMVTLETLWQRAKDVRASTTRSPLPSSVKRSRASFARFTVFGRPPRHFELRPSHIADPWIDTRATFSESAFLRTRLRASSALAWAAELVSFTPATKRAEFSPEDHDLTVSSEAVSASEVDATSAHASFLTFHFACATLCAKGRDLASSSSFSGSSGMARVSLLFLSSRRAGALARSLVVRSQRPPSLANFPSRDENPRRGMRVEIASLIQIRDDLNDSCRTLPLHPAGRSHQRSGREWSKPLCSRRRSQLIRSFPAIPNSLALLNPSFIKATCASSGSTDRGSTRFDPEPSSLSASTAAARPVTSDFSWLNPLAPWCAPKSAGPFLTRSPAT